MRSFVAASLAGAAVANYQCPGSPAWFNHAGLRMTSTAAASCDVVKAEMKSRVAGENGWYDQHNRGTYTEQNYGGDISFSRLTGDGKYTDKMTFVLTSEGSGCKIEGCSEAQVTSVLDFSTNYCEQKLMYCGSDEGCKVANSDFTHTEDEKKTMSGASTKFSDCLKVAETKVEVVSLAAGTNSSPSVDLFAEDTPEPSHPCRGCAGKELPADEAILGFFSAHAEIQSQAQQFAQEQGMNADIPMFMPIRYVTQVTNGHNWFVRVQIQRDTDVFADVAIYQHWDVKSHPPQIFGLKLDVDRDAPIHLFGHGPSVV